MREIKGSKGGHYWAERGGQVLGLAGRQTKVSSLHFLLVPCQGKLSYMSSSVMKVCVSLLMYEAGLVEDDVSTNCVRGLTGQYKVITAEIC